MLPRRRSQVRIGLLEGNPAQFLSQITGLLIAGVLGAGGTLVILKVVDLCIGLRVSETDEIEGLDETQHGETVYVSEVQIRIPYAEGLKPLAPRGAIEDILPAAAGMET